MFSLCQNTLPLKVKNPQTGIGVQGHTHACTHMLSPPFPRRLSAFLCPVTVMDGECVAYSCIQLTNCPSPITAPPLCDLWKTGRDRMSRQLRLKKGTEDADKPVWNRCIWRKLYICGLRGRWDEDELLLCVQHVKHIFLAVILLQSWLWELSSDYVSALVLYIRNCQQQSQNLCIKQAEVWIHLTGFNSEAHRRCVRPHLKWTIWPTYSPAVPAYSIT